MKFLILVLLSLSCVFAQINVHNGNTLILQFYKNEVKNLKIGKKKLKLLSHPTNRDKNIVLIPIKYRQKNDIILSYIHENKIKTMNIKVKQKKYKKEILKVANKKVTPPKHELKRISHEYKEAMKIYSTFSKKRQWNKSFLQPIDAQITSQYGNARLFNKKLKSFHGGTDFKAKMKTPIKASNDGVVVLVKNRYYAGNSIIIDHGQGIYSCYYHLYQFFVKAGQKVKRGDVIGLSGKSGRVTGPHLHFTIMISGVSVDSQDFLSKINLLFKD